MSPVGVFASSHWLLRSNGASEGLPLATVALELEAYEGPRL